MASGTAQVNDWQTVQHPDVNDWQTVNSGQGQQPSFVDNLVKSAGNAASSLVNAVAHPIDTVKNMADVLSAATTGTGMIRAVHGDNPAATALADHFATRYGSIEQAKKTAYEDPVGFALDAAQLIGPAADVADVAIPGRLAAIKVPAMAAHLDPSEAAAVGWMKANNIPVDAATATGNPVVRNVQSLLAHTIGPADKAKSFMTEQKGALQAVGEGLAEKFSLKAAQEATGESFVEKPITSATPETAGAGIRKGLEDSVSDLSTKASGAYTRLRNIEESATPETVQTGTREGSVIDPSTGKPTQIPVTKQITAPVDLSGMKQALTPIEKQLSEVLTPAQQQFSKGLTAIRGVLNAPDSIPASVADQTLSGLKAIMREDVPPQTKFLIGKVIDQMSPQVDAAVAKLGPSATQALQDGRSLTQAKYAAKGTLDSLNDEPVKLYGQLTQAKDANINLLRDVASKAPDAIPAVGRSVLDGLIDKAYAEVDSAKPGTALTEWNKLGPSTKAILFKDPKLIGDLDNFFNASKMVAKNPNPSGSGFIAGLTADGTLAVTAPHIAVPYIIGRSALGRMLYSPGGAKLLTEGMKIPVGNTAANGLVAGRILQLAGNDAKPMSSGQ